LLEQAGDFSGFWDGRVVIDAAGYRGVEVGREVVVDIEGEHDDEQPAHDNLGQRIGDDDFAGMIAFFVMMLVNEFEHWVLVKDY